MPQVRVLKLGHDDDPHPPGRAGNGCLGTDTARRLAEMSDVAAFERIAAAVLRAANSWRYAILPHPGVQPGGKTVKAPFDNVRWVQSPQGARFVCAAHTTEQHALFFRGVRSHLRALGARR